MSEPTRANVTPPVGRAAAYEFAEWNPVFLRPDGRPWPGWEAKVIERIPLPAPLDYLEGGKVTKIAVHRKAALPLQKALMEIHKAGLWRFLSPYGGGYEFRRISGSDKLSLHALGLAVDFDPARNARDLPAEQSRFGTPEGLAVVKLFALYGWSWGGHFRPRPDAMHFSSPPAASQQTGAEGERQMKEPAPESLWLAPKRADETIKQRTKKKAEAPDGVQAL